MTDNPLDLDKLEAKLASSLSVTNYGVAERDRDIVKTGALLSIARSLESNKVPDHWESLEGPSGAVLGWFDPQVARAIAQALGATEARQATTDADPAPRPVVVGSVVALNEALAFALDQGAPELAGLGEVLDVGISEGAEWALVRWDDDDAGTEPGKVWVSDLTALEAREAEPVSEPEAAAWAEAGEAFEQADLTPHIEALDEAVTVIADNSGFDIEPDDGAGDPAPEPEVDDDDIDADFDTVVEAPPAVDGLAALKGKSNKRK
jgi:hypothetical protein